ncbi:MAG: hypothetical protein JXQ90_00145 [Cyclobacteriaceae bacterium]
MEHIFYHNRYGFIFGYLDSMEEEWYRVELCRPVSGLYARWGRGEVKCLKRNEIVFSTLQSIESH